MAKMNLEELRKLREEKKKAISKRDVSNKDIQVIIGMGTCGLAAGAKDTYNAFLDEMDQHSIENVVIRQTGCMGLCHAEPTVEVIMPDMPKTIYGNVDDTVARKIVRKHILNKHLVNNHVFDKPAPDIINE